MKWYGWVCLSLIILLITFALLPYHYSESEIVGTETITGIVTSINVQNMAKQSLNAVNVTVDRETLDVTKLYKNDITVGKTYTFYVTITKSGASMFETFTVNNYSEVN